MADKNLLNEIINLAKHFIAIPSTADNLPALEEILALARDELTSFEMEKFSRKGKSSLLVHNAKPGTKDFKVILNAHLDVVAGKEHQYVPLVKDGKLYGRGAIDMKTTAALMIYLFKEVAPTLPYPLAFQIVTDEEIAGGEGTKYQLSQGVQSEIAIVGECGSRLDIINETKGLIHATITASGITSHGAYPWKGENAILKINKAIAAIHKHFPVPTSETFDTTVNVSKISTTNETWNKVPDHCSATLDIRFGRKSDKNVLEKIKKLLPEGVTLEVQTQRTYNYVDPNNSYIQLLKKIGSNVLGHELKIRSAFGGSDSVFFAKSGLHAIDFGPIGHGQHHDDEWVDIKSLEDYYMILKNFLLAIDEK